MNFLIKIKILQKKIVIIIMNFLMKTIKFQKKKLIIIMNFLIKIKILQKKIVLNLNAQLILRNPLIQINQRKTMYMLKKMRLIIV